MALIVKLSSAQCNKKHPANERPGCSFVSSLIRFSIKLRLQFTMAVYNLQAERKKIYMST